MGQPRRLTRDLYVKLTAEERDARGRRLAEAIHERMVNDDVLAAARAAHKQRDKTLETEIRHLAKVVNRGDELRPVECEERPNWQAGTMEVYRLDTGEMADFRAMTSRERQGELDFEESETN